MGMILIWVCVIILGFALGYSFAEFGKRIRRLTDMMSNIGAQAAQNRREMQEALENAVKSMTERVQRLEQGAVPDYEAARKAKAELDSFNIGIANILGYNQRDALKKKEESAE